MGRQATSKKEEEDRQAALKKEEERDKIKVGDTVRLKSGGPLMTVEVIIEEESNFGKMERLKIPKCKCIWFDLINEQQTATSLVPVLMKATNTKGT